ncbi:hypothetical protein PoB_002487700 [Plakobranchus ocellatus]|uniref:Uncharacterized protein n=1 Tax=Plakobranchus ocellatus TaxID=259542 RepID=A0AAV3ZTB2_9GAST|nr:hypothetical protein PoB_002487700 [Plakobranchus ocellatus]
MKARLNREWLTISGTFGLKPATDTESHSPSQKSSDHQLLNGITKQGDLRFSGPLLGQDADGGARIRHRRVPADLRADSLATVPPTPQTKIGGSYLESLTLQEVQGLNVADGGVRCCRLIQFRRSLLKFFHAVLLTVFQSYCSDIACQYIGTIESALYLSSSFGL